MIVVFGPDGGGLIIVVSLSAGGLGLGLIIVVFDGAGAGPGDRNIKYAIKSAATTMSIVTTIAVEEYVRASSLLYMAHLVVELR